MNPVALITGSNSGIGLETALYLARHGYTVWATMRNLQKADELRKIIESERLPVEIAQLDVRDDNSVKSAVEQILQKSGRIDVLINNAGYGLRGAAEEVRLDEWKQQFETNFFGVIRVTQAVLPQMRQQRSGAIVNISSVLGRMAIPFAGPYTSSKFALEGLSETLRYELAPWNIKVILIEPGFIATKFQENAQLAQAAQDDNSPYTLFKQASGRRIQRNIYRAAPSVIVAETIYRAITHPNPKLRYPVGRDARYLLPLRRFLPSRVFEYLLKRQLGL
ncbi:MAG: SDR family oxidoreductase [Candidatus Bipolaricaulota bacterium]|nr:SDR family oxidoreductase [Candidatus Bipolaricaulota bacterium]MCS7274017.1 SDR family oxidoreductase [Candidatus Bipolaricaulota bacterium]MDW8111370.1 SDR family oxidoreductase [Candidatus Bipolaricaulota bacterium]MDW8329914.1 SDR family oxidoreductase [Candidatus Bipolaricaulota bacterium]